MWCRRRESNDTRLLILRNLLEIYERKNRKTRCMGASSVQNHVQEFEGRVSRRTRLLASLQVKLRKRAHWPKAANSTANLEVTLFCHSSMASRLEQLNWIAVGIFNLNLFAARAYLPFISKTYTRLFQLSNARRQILQLKKHTVPSAWFLLTAIRHWSGPRCARTTQD